MLRDDIIIKWKRVNNKTAVNLKYLVYNGNNNNNGIDNSKPKAPYVARVENVAPT